MAHFFDNQGKDGRTTVIEFVTVNRSDDDVTKIHGANRFGDAARFIDPDIDAAFRLDPGEGGLEVSMKTPDRWLSQSVEATLVNSGDAIEELIDEELVELGCEDGPLPLKHFRDEQMRYVFVSPAPAGATPETLLACLRAYERAFAPLGDFAGEDDD